MRRPHRRHSEDDSSARRNRRSQTSTFRRERGSSSERRVTQRVRRSERDLNTSGPRRRLQVLPEEIEKLLEEDPRFKIIMLDGRHWIDPYSSRPILLDPNNIEKEIERYLLKHKPYRTLEPLPEQRLQFVKWTHDLARMIQHEPRLRFFGRGGRGWINPFAGTVHPDVVATDNVISRQTIEQISAILSECEYAKAGIMRNRNDLLEIAKTQNQRSQEQAQAEHLNQDLSKARELQESLLQKNFELPGYDVAVCYEGHSQVSGDFYLLLPLENNQKYLILLGDVSGHGVQAALVVATLIKTAKLLLPHHDDLINLLSALNDEIKDDLMPGQFVTCFAGVLDVQEDELSVVLCGHHPVLLANLEGPEILRELGNKGMAMGLIKGGMFGKSLSEEKVQLKAGDVLLQYTDGIIEAMNAQKEEFGEQRLYADFIRFAHGETNQIVHTLADRVKRFCDGQLDDDLTIMALSLPKIEAFESEDYSSQNSEVIEIEFS